MRCFVFCLTLLLFGSSLHAQEAAHLEAVETFFRQLDSALAADMAQPPAEPRAAIGSDILRRRRAANQRDTELWRGIQSLEGWQAVRASRLAALQRSLGAFPESPASLNARVTRMVAGDGFEIDCLIFESRPGLLVTANLYRPIDPQEARPALLICHSHHNPKTQGELQDMGMIWARAGCTVLVMDQLGHGERRQHPFAAAEDYELAFPVSRQDYYFRYNVGIQLHLIGDSLMGWMVNDLRRGVDLLLDQPGVDPKRIVLLGAVAGGGDPCAVTAALDQRVALAVPFNFGGPQPENEFPLPPDAESRFNYVGSGSWESTRNLRLSAGDGFLPWLIVGSIAPRGLIYAHEFSWDRDHDPVWRRLQSIYGWYNGAQRLASLSGYGKVQMSASEASHCNNIGAYHRSQLYPLMRDALGIEVPDSEFRDRREWEELFCVAGVESAGDVQMPRLHQLANRKAIQQIARFRHRLERLPPAARRDHLRVSWQVLLGIDSPAAEFIAAPGRSIADEPVRVERFVCRSGSLTIPLVMITLRQVPDAGCPAVVGVAQGGTAGFLKHRAAELAELLAGGVAVCLPDLPAFSETAYRGRRSLATKHSSDRLMLGGTILGDRLQELLAVVGWLRTLEMVDGERIAIWGDSFAPPNPPQRDIAVPMGINGEPDLAEPIGALLSLLAGLFDERLAAVLARGGLVSLRSVLDSQFVYLPHEVVVPGTLTAGDLADLAGALSPRPLRIEGLVDGLNRRAAAETIETDWETVSGREGLIVSGLPTADYVGWLVAVLQRGT